MAPRLTAGELDLTTHCLGKNQEPKEIQRVLNARRQAKRIEILKIWAIRRACRGVTHQRGRSDGRGKKQSMTAAQVDRLNETRKRLLAKAKTEMCPHSKKNVSAIAKHMETVKTFENRYENYI